MKSETWGRRGISLAPEGVRGEARLGRAAGARAHGTAHSLHGGPFVWMSLPLLACAGIGTSWFRAQVCVNWNRKDAEGDHFPRVRAVRTCHAHLQASPQAVRVALITLPKDFVSLGKLWADVDTSREESEGLVTSWQTSESLLAEGWTCCFQHFLTLGYAEGWGAEHQTPGCSCTPGALCLKLHSSSSPSRQQLKQGSFQEKCNYQNAWGVEFFSNGPRKEVRLWLVSLWSFSRL